MSYILNRIAIVGTGLIGTSIGLALRRRSRGVHIAGWDRARANAKSARLRGALTSVAASLGAAVAGADLIVLAAPLRAIEKLIPRVLAIAPSGTLVLDVGPLKERVAAIAGVALRSKYSERTAVRRKSEHRGALFVAGHPLAGSERHGPGAASADLFEGRPFALFAPEQTHRSLALRKAETVVRALGAVPVWLEPSAHDRAVASTSALPQLASIALALASWRMLGRNGPKLAGPGFDGATRLADSPFHVWEAALFENARNVRRALLALERHVAGLAKVLGRGDRRKMSNLFRQAAAARRRILEISPRSKRPRNS